MSTIAEFRVPADALLLGATLERLPDLRVRFESAISTSLPSLWMRGYDRGPIDEALATDPSVTSFDYLASVDGRLLYDLTDAEECRRVREAFLAEGGSLLRASAVNAQWHVEMRFRDRSALSRTHERVTDAGVPIEVTRVTDLTEVAARGAQLTPEQREALTAALERGYFEIPRRTSMEELAEELGISHQALSERLRRAYESLVDAELQPMLEP